MEFEGIPFQVIRRRVKYSRVEFKEGGLQVIVPRGINPRQVLEDNKTAILRKHHKLLNQIETARRIPMVEWPEERFRQMVHDYVAQYSHQLEVEVHQVKFRKMKRRWGSCRSDAIITFNTFLQFVPEHLIAYIVYHELTHLLVRGHNREFKRIIAAGFPNYRKLDKELNLYGLKLLS
jgi:predicted metal-dependent hydrolase